MTITTTTGEAMTRATHFGTIGTPTTPQLCREPCHG